jgi:hypothetical protein
MILAAIEDEPTQRQIKYRPTNLFPRSAQYDWLRDSETRFACFGIRADPQMLVVACGALAHHS